MFIRILVAAMLAGAPASAADRNTTPDGKQSCVGHEANRDLYFKVLDVIFNDIQLDRVEELLAQPVERCQQLLGVGVLGFEILDHFVVVAIAQPVVVVDASVAEGGQFGGTAFGVRRLRSHAVILKQNFLRDPNN